LHGNLPQVCSKIFRKILLQTCGRFPCKIFRCLFFSAMRYKAPPLGKPWALYLIARKEKSSDSYAQHPFGGGDGGYSGERLPGCWARGFRGLGFL
jgi:hypothetical protein